MPAPTVAEPNAAYVDYEYKTVQIPLRDVARYRDVAARFGWMPDGSPPTVARRTATFGLTRPVNLPEREALVQLEHDSDDSFAALEALEQSSRRVPSAVAYVVGLSGTAAMAVSVFALQADDHLLSIGRQATKLLEPR